MAVRGRPLDAATVRRVQRAREALSVRKTARACDVDPKTVQKYARKKSG